MDPAGEMPEPEMPGKSQALGTSLPTRRFRSWMQRRSLFRELSRLGKDGRRLVLERSFSEAQRAALEQWMLRRRAKGAPCGALKGRGCRRDGSRCRTSRRTRAATGGKTLAKKATCLSCTRRGVVATAHKKPGAQSYYAVACSGMLRLTMLLCNMDSPMKVSPGIFGFEPFPRSNLAPQAPGLFLQSFQSYADVPDACRPFVPQQEDIPLPFCDSQEQFAELRKMAPLQTPEQFVDSSPVYPSHGSIGHPEMCRRPCVYLVGNRGPCPAGPKCSHRAQLGYCHLEHTERRVALDKRQREFLRRLTESDSIAVVLPHLRAPSSESDAFGIAQSDQSESNSAGATMPPQSEAKFLAELTEVPAGWPLATVIDAFLRLASCSPGQAGQDRAREAVSFRLMELWASQPEEAEAWLERFAKEINGMATRRERLSEALLRHGAAEYGKYGWYWN
eukprot:s633_g17.t1